jgi:CDP-diacylglycerol---serine O-phosphatidyltransferase
MAGPAGKVYIAAMAMHQPGFDGPRAPRLPRLRRRRFRRIPVRTLVPNVITLLALCAGLTAIRLAFENQYVLALAAIVFAAVLDAIDGRLARLLKGTSRFGAELDSLADFVNFGVAPALILYFWGLHDLKSAGWIAAMVFAICAGLRLARFNVMIDDPERPAWAGKFFVGMPAPAGAITVLLPIYAAFLGFPRTGFLTWLTLVYTLVIASLMVSRLPVFSGKRIGKRVPPELVLPLIVVVVLFIALLIAYPWVLLTAGTLAYLVSLPFGWLSYREHERRSRESRAEPAPASATQSAPVPPPFPPPRAGEGESKISPPRAGEGREGDVRPAENEDRPSRLN